MLTSGLRDVDVLLRWRTCSEVLASTHADTQGHRGPLHEALTDQGPISVSGCSAHRCGEVGAGTDRGVFYPVIVLCFQGSADEKHLPVLDRLLFR